MVVAAATLKVKVEESGSIRSVETGVYGAAVGLDVLSYS